MEIVNDAFKIYIAGPMTTGSVDDNIRKGIAVGTAIWDLGFAVYIPHLTHMWSIMHPHDYEDWMAQDFVWLKACNALLRVPGESPGADREMIYAEENGIPVFHTPTELLDWAQTEGMNVDHLYLTHPAVRSLAALWSSL